MPVIRTIIDIEVPDHVSKGDAAKYAENLKDYAAVVLGPELTEKSTAELNAVGSHHTHNGVGGGCRPCYRLHDDGKN